MRWVNRAVALIVTVVSVLVVVFPPPSLPLRYLPVAGVVVLAVMLIWQQGRTEPIPSSHVDELRRLADSLIADVDSRRAPRFSPDAQRDRLLRAAFRSHFPEAYRSLEKFETLLKQDEKAQSDLSTRVLTETGMLASTYKLQDETVRSVLMQTAQSQLGAEPTAVKDPGPFMIQVTPRWGTHLFLGASGIATSASRTPQQDLEKAQQAFIDATLSVPSWEQTQAARSARIALLGERDAVRGLLVEITHRPSLPGHCRLCAAN